MKCHQENHAGDLEVLPHAVGEGEEAAETIVEDLDHHHLEEGVHFPQEEEAPLQEGGAEAEVAQDLPPTEGPDLHTKEDKQKRLPTRFSSPSVLAKFTVKFM